MYEYQVACHYGQTPPSSLVAPIGFRLRDMKFVEQSRGIHNEPMHATDGLYIRASTESVFGHWIMIWERYVPQKEGSE